MSIIDEYAESVYKNCLATNQCNMVLNGKFYHCGFLMSGEALCAFPYLSDNHVDILDPTTTKEDLIRYKSTEKGPPGCKYCSGQSIDAAIVPKAEQVTEPISYKIYK